jgi:hypothetical protein
MVGCVTKGVYTLGNPDEWELASRSSIDSQGTFNLDEADFEAQVPYSSQRGIHPWDYLQLQLGPISWHPAAMIDDSQKVT